ncbi:phage head-tail connector protein [Lysinibacillus sp. NPDC093688]|uniref:phage head-tail connector protein n=1 Tax=Lysinibacillus sp. NPDC093688 TaxID=3390577 RepID=UPI003D0413FB
MWQPTQEEIEQLKQLNEVTGAKHDAFYRAMAPVLFDVAKDHCNGKWEPSDMPQGVRLFIAKAIQFNTQSTGLKGRTMGTVSYSYDTEFPKAIWTYLRPYKKVRFRALR